MPAGTARPRRSSGSACGTVRFDAVARFANRDQQSRFVSPNAFAYGSDGMHPRWDKIEHLFKACSTRYWYVPERGPRRSLSATSRLACYQNAPIQNSISVPSPGVMSLKSLPRGHTVADVLRAMDLCREHSLVPVVDFIVGLPFESDDDQRANPWPGSGRPRYGTIHAHRFIPLPCTPLAGQAR